MRAQRGSEKTTLLAAHYCPHRGLAGHAPSLSRSPRSAWLKLLLGLTALAYLAGSALKGGSKAWRFSPATVLQLRQSDKTLDASLLRASSPPPASREAERPSAVPWTTDPFNPTSIPLAARSPYLNVWLEAGNRARRGILNSQFGKCSTMLWFLSLNDAHVLIDAAPAAAFNGNWLPWVVGVLVDGQPYTAMSTPGRDNGLDGPAAEQTAMTFTPSSTAFTMRAVAITWLTH